MACFALLCGSAPKGFRQRKIEDTYDFLEKSAVDKRCKPGNIVVFPNGINELVLETLLNEAFDRASDEDEGNVFLHLCVQKASDLNAFLSDSAIPDVEVIRLCKDEIRKDVIAYYIDLAEKMGIGFQVEYSVDGDFVREEILGYEKVSGGSDLC